MLESSSQQILLVSASVLRLSLDPDGDTNSSSTSSVLTDLHVLLDMHGADDDADDTEVLADIFSLL